MRVNVLPPPPQLPLSLMFFFCSVQPIYCYFLVPAAPQFFLPRPYSLSDPPLLCRQPIRPTLFYTFVPSTHPPPPHCNRFGSCTIHFFVTFRPNFRVSLPTRVPLLQCPVTSGFPLNSPHPFSFPDQTLAPTSLHSLLPSFTQL